MQATGIPSRAPVYDGPFDCRPYLGLGVKTTGRATVKRLARRKFECLPIAKRAQDYNRGFGIIRHNIPKVAANNSFGILRNLTSDNKAIVFTKLLFVAGK